jgi:hypothetical protein
LRIDAFLVKQIWLTDLIPSKQLPWLSSPYPSMDASFLRLGCLLGYTSPVANVRTRTRMGRNICFRHYALRVTRHPGILSHNFILFSHTFLLI